MRYYDRKGQPIDAKEVYSASHSYKRVAYTELPNGLRVSTVWLGLDHNWGEGKPLIFETMVFSPDRLLEVYAKRYTTEEEAVAGHDEALSLFKDKTMEELKKQLKEAWSDPQE